MNKKSVLTAIITTIITMPTTIILFGAIMSVFGYRFEKKEIPANFSFENTREEIEARKLKVINYYLKGAIIKVSWNDSNGIHMEKRYSLDENPLTITRDIYSGYWILISPPEHWINRRKIQKEIELTEEWKKEVDERDVNN